MPSRDVVCQWRGVAVSATAVRFPLAGSAVGTLVHLMSDGSDTSAARAADNAVPPIDGRMARRQKNIDAVLDVVMTMFTEELLVPTIEQAASRSGLSSRSIYRYFADPAELIEATVKRSEKRFAALAHLHAIGEGPLDHRVEAFVDLRLQVYEVSGSVFRATVINAAQYPRIRDELTKTRNQFREQFELQFAPELAKIKPVQRQAIMASGELIAQLDSIDFLRRHRQFTVAETRATLTTALHSLLG